jgi:DNA-binding IclR family transcriptional regulator
MQPVRRALRVLATVAEHGGGLTLQELSLQMGLPPSTVHRLVAVLQSEGYLLRTPVERRYVLGHRVRSLVASTSSAFVQEAARSELARLNRATGEAVFVAEFVGPHVVCIAFLPGTRPLRLFVSLGAMMPLHAASSARVLLASLDPDEWGPLLKNYRYTSWTPRTITGEDELLRHLELVRSRGYDIDNDEMNDSGWGASAPIRDLHGRVRASVTVVAPIVHVQDPARREFLVAEVMRAAGAISAELGCGLDDGSAANAADPDAPDADT